MSAVTDAAIMALHDHACTAGDLLMAAICQMAVEGAVRCNTLECLSKQQVTAFRHRFPTPESARVQCVRVIIGEIRSGYQRKLQGDSK